jgi:hypothetical protein
MTKEADEGKASVEERWGSDEREKQKYWCKNWERTVFIKPFYFHIHTTQNEIQTPELLSAALYFYKNPIFPFVRNFKNMY